MTVFLKAKEGAFTGDVFTLEGMQKERQSYIYKAKIYIQNFINQSYTNIKIHQHQIPDDAWSKEDVAKWQDGIDYLIKMYNNRINTLEDLLKGPDEDILEYYFGMRGIEFIETIVST